MTRLEVAWESDLPGRGAYGNAATTPLIFGDTVYVEDLTSSVHAIDRATGAKRWTHSNQGFAFGPNGVAVGWGKVFAILGTKAVMALDAATGDELWTRELNRTPTEGVDIQPTLYAGLVLASSVPVSLNGIYTGGDRGVLYGLDASDGSVVWTFDTVDSPDLWGNPGINSGGGAWYSPAIDPTRGRVYWGVANPAPFPGIPGFPNGSSRPGPNLYTNSVVVLDARAGELEWYRQAIPHDLFDRDLVHVLLVEVESGGRARTIVVATGKLGRVIGHDIDTGEVLWDTPVGLHQNDDLTELSGPTTIFPGTYGGVLTPPAAAGGVVYVATVNASDTLPPDQTFYFGARFGQGPGQIVAVDAATGAILWDVPIDGDPLGGATVVNDLLFVATFDGMIYALDRASGQEVWRYAAAGGINGWPAAADDMLIWPIGLAQPPRLLALRVPAGL